MADDISAEGQDALRERILDQHEIDEAMGFAGPEAAPEGDARVMVGAGAVPRERMPMLPIILDDLCSRLSVTLRAFFGTEAAVSLETVAQRRYLDFLDDVVVPAQLVTFRAEGWDGFGLLAIGPDFATLALDTLLGGNSAEGRPLTRPFSQIESVILSRIADSLLNQAEAAFCTVTPVAFRRDRIESDPRLVSIAQPGETVVSIALRISLDGRAALVLLALPLSTLEPARTALRSGFMGTKPGLEDHWATHFATEVWQSSVETETVLHETKLPLRQVLALAIGDTLMFDMRPGDLVEVRCGGLPITRGHIGRVEGRIAVQVAEPVLRPRAGHSEGMPL